MTEAADHRAARPGALTAGLPWLAGAALVTALTSVRVELSTADFMLQL